VNGPSHCWRSFAVFGNMWARALARSCVWIALGGRRPSEGVSAVRRKTAAAAMSTSLLESRGLTPCVCNYDDGDDDFKGLKWGFYFLHLYCTRIYPVGSKNNTYNIDEAVFDIHVRKVVVVFTAVWAAHVSAKLSALFLPVRYVCDIGCAKGG